MILIIIFENEKTSPVLPDPARQRRPLPYNSFNYLPYEGFCCISRLTLVSSWGIGKINLSLG